MKYQDVLKRFVSQQAQLLQEKQMEQQLKEQMLAAKAQALGSFIPGQMQSPQEQYSEAEYNPFVEGQEYKAGGIHIDPSKKGTFKAQATRMGMSIQEAASHILNNKEKYSSAMVKKANFAKNFAKEEGGIFTGEYEYPEGGTTNDDPIKEFMKTPEFKKGLDRMMSNSKKDNTDSFLEAMTEANYPQEVYDKYYNMMGSDAWQKAIPSQSQYQKRGKMGEYQDMMNQLEGSQRYNTPYGKFAEGPSSVLARDMRTDKEVDEDSKREFLLNAISSGLKARTPYDDGRVDPRTLEAIQPSVNEYEGMKKGGEMIRRADGSYSQRGLWDNIRDNRGSGKKPTKEMLEQERKINNKYPDGGITKTFKSKDGTITNVKQNADGSKTVQVRTKDGKYSEKVIPMDYWNKIENLNNSFKEDDIYEDILEFVDVTGFSSYDDVQRAYNKNGLFDAETMLEIAGALPVIGKFGKLTKGLKLGTDAFKEYKLSKMLRGADAVGTAGQAVDIAFREGGSFNNPGFNALPEAVQDKIIAAMMYGGYIGNNNWH